MAIETPLPEAVGERERVEPADEELMTRCQSGDNRAMDLLVSRYHLVLYRFAYRMLHEREAAEDAAQETLLRAYRSAGRFRTGERLSTWLFAIAANVCRSEISRRSRRNECDWEGLGNQAAPGSVEGAALRQAEGAAVHRALASLTADHRLVVVLFYFEEMSQQEIARVCGCRVGTVKSRLHYALRRLRQLLAPSECREDGGSAKQVKP